MTEETPTVLAVKPRVHRVELGSAKFACCGRTPFTVPMRDGVTTDPHKVTCRAAGEREG